MINNFVTILMAIISFTSEIYHNKRNIDICKFVNT